MLAGFEVEGPRLSKFSFMLICDRQIDLRFRELPGTSYQVQAKSYGVFMAAVEYDGEFLPVCFMSAVAAMYGLSQLRQQVE